MRYMGSKARIAKYILPIILKDRKPGQYYVEPFCGGCNSLQLVNGLRIGADIHPQLIALLKAVQSGWVPDVFINEDEYNRIKKGGNPVLQGYAGFLFSFGAKYMSTFRRHGDGHIQKGADLRGTDLKGNYASIAYTNKAAKKVIVAMGKQIQDVVFANVSYDKLAIPPQSIIYCDPPYAGTTSYKDGINYNKFYDWCRFRKAQGHMVFVSEYSMPSDFKCIWSKDIESLIKVDSRFRVTEKLFTL